MLSALLLSLLQSDTSYARAESLLASGDLRGARAVAERLVAASPNDPRSHLLMGRVWYAWPAIGRYSALAEFRLAARLAPADPEPLYWQVRVGQYLKSDEGERLAREAILRIFAITPDYEDCWELFEGLYHNAKIWRRADLALARHPESLLALERRARIAIALEEPSRADSLAAIILSHHVRSVPALLLRAEAAFNDGRDPDGFAWYDSALTVAELDSTDALWDGVWMIASPGEVDRARTTRPADWGRFFASFWGKRDPNLVTRENERIAEHYRRLAYVRRMFHLLHPWALPHHSALARSLQAYRDRVVAQEMIGSAPSIVSSSHDSALLAHGLGPRAEQDAGVDLQFRAGLDSRGLMWVRHGQPELRMTGVLDPIRGVAANEPLDEAWIYETDAGEIVLSFGTPGGGDTRSLPLTRGQLAGQQLLLETDRTTLPATLEARGWSAFFKSESPDHTEFYVRTAPETAAVVLWDTGGAEERARASGVGLLRLTAPPGAYQMGLDVDSAGAIGRIRQVVRLPRYSGATAGISSLVLAPGDSLRDREAALAGMPADLEFASGAALSSYAELYGLGGDGGGRARYRVRYTFQPLRPLLARLWSGGSPVVFEFDREADWRSALPERLVIQPGRLPPGRYRVTLSVTDIPSNVKSETVALVIRVR